MTFSQASKPLSFQAEMIQRVGSQSRSGAVASKRREMMAEVLAPEPFAADFGTPD